MILPPFLKAGDEVRIVSPAKVILPKEIEYAQAQMTARGWNVTLGKNTFNSWNRFAGTDDERLSDVQDALDDRNVNAIFFARGGYGSVRIIDRLEYDQFHTHPKWLVGFSDITVFHQHIHQHLGIVTCHGPMPLNMTDADANKKSSHMLFEALSGTLYPLEIRSHPLNSPGKLSGQLTGGNLSVLTSLLGTNSCPDFNHKILFIEDLCEELYHLDRMMYQLKKSGILRQVRGILIGSFTEMTDVSGWFKEDAYGIIHNHLGDLMIPMAFGIPSGHQPMNLPLLMGLNYEIEIGETSTHINAKTPH